MKKPTPFKDPFDKRSEQYTPARVDLFNSANRAFPLVRERERQHIIQRLELQPGVVVCDIAAGGGYLSEGIYQALEGDCRIICVENSRAFADSLPKHFSTVVCSLSSLSLPDRSVDRVACLAGIHHQKDKLSFFKEAFRILRPGGVIAVGDVLKSTPTARFLNEAVDRHSDLGHDGYFLEEGELEKLLGQAGFTNIAEKHEQYHWTFPNTETMVSFSKTLFRMVKADLPTVKNELFRYLNIEETKGSTQMGWSLLYASATKPK